MSNKNSGSDFALGIGVALVFVLVMSFVTSYISLKHDVSAIRSQLREYSYCKNP